MTRVIKNFDKDLRARIGKLATPQLIKRYNESKFEGEELEIAKYFIKRRGVEDQITYELDDTKAPEAPENVQETSIEVSYETKVEAPEPSPKSIFIYNNNIQLEILNYILNKYGLTDTAKLNKKIEVRNFDEVQLINAHKEYDNLIEINKGKYKAEVTEVYKGIKMEHMEEKNLTKLSEVYMFPKLRSELRKDFIRLQKAYEIDYNATI